MPRLSRKSSPHAPESSHVSQGVRMRVFQWVILGVALFLVGRLYVLQIREAQKWKALAASQHTLSQNLQAERGSIYFHDGDSLYPGAVNREYRLVYAVPRDIENVPQTAALLAPLFSLDETQLRDRLTRRQDDPFEIIKRHVEESEMVRLKELDLKGIYSLPETYRFYPADALGSKVLGFVAPTENGDVGVYGVEASLNAILRGEDGKISQENDPTGRWIPLSDRENVHAVNGDSLVLSLDHVIQYQVEEILKRGLERYGADAVSAIVMEPKTGRILAMASLPSFNPNEYGKADNLALFMNPTVSLPYEPGSVMKGLTMAIGIEEEKISPSTEYVDTGVVSEGGYAIRNAQEKVYGRSNMIKVLDESINTGVIFVERLVGNVRFRDYLERFGFGRRTGVSLPAENPGSLRNLDNPRQNIGFYTASFGQGVSVTPLQMVSAYAAIANGGVLMKPQIIDRFIKADGTIEGVKPEEVRRVVSEETARKTGEMLRDVVVNGHGKRADVPGYQVVGKTGTAQVAKSGSKGYEDVMTVGSFIGYAPMSDPKYVVLVKVDNPKDVEWAESSAAPTFGEIMQFLLSYGKVQPVEAIKGKTP